MALALFDLDNTLIAGDSDHAWGEYLVASGIADEERYRRGNDYFYQQYVDGALDIYEYIRFAVSPLMNAPLEEYEYLRTTFVSKHIEPLLLDKAFELVNHHKQQGDKTAIVTATNRFVTEPIAQLFEVDTLIATELQVINGVLTGEILGTPCFQNGKIERVTNWLGKSEQELCTAHFYSDSHNDIPLLSAVGNPVAVDPDQKLAEHASQSNWPMLSLRQ